MTACSEAEDEGGESTCFKLIDTASLVSPWEPIDGAFYLFRVIFNYATTAIVSCADAICYLLTVITAACRNPTEVGMYESDLEVELEADSLRSCADYDARRLTRLRLDYHPVGCLRLNPRRQHSQHV